MSKKTKKAVGIDIGSHFMKIAILSYTDNHIELEKFIVQKTPAQLVVNGVIQFPDDLGEIVQSILQEEGIKVKQASISIPVGEETAILKWVNVPDLKPKEMQKAVHSIIEDELLHPPDSLYYNWQRINEKEKNNDGAVELILVGVLKPAMDNHLQFLKKTKIKPYYAEADIFSTLRSIFSPKEFLNPTVNKMVIDIGANETIMGFIQNGKFAYMRNVPMGGQSWIQQLCDSRGLNPKEAEEELLNNGAVAENIYELSFDEQVTAEVVTPMLEGMTDVILDTIYFYKDFSKGEIDEIILTGGGARLKGMEEYMSNRLNIPCHIGTPHFIELEEEKIEPPAVGNFFEKSEEEQVPEQVQDTLKSVLPSLNIAIGLALKEVYDNV